MQPGKMQPGKTQPGKTQPGKTQPGETQAGETQENRNRSARKNHTGAAPPLLHYVAHHGEYGGDSRHEETRGD